MTKAIITCENVSKSFDVPMGGQQSIRGRLLHPFERTATRRLDAIDDVSVTIREGEFFGIVGRNGSGKSTLLKMLAGIYHADSGSIRVQGRVAPFIELGVGFNPDLSARENLFLNGVLLGLTRKELAYHYDTIVDFAELHEFMDMRLRNFSSGMQVRLAFGIALQSGADILLIDEVLAVGDERFQRKCFDTFADRRAAGQTVIFVSHDMGAVSRFCDRAMLIEHGKCTTLGDPTTVARRYFDLNLESGSAHARKYEAIEDVELKEIDHLRPGLEILEAHTINALDDAEQSTFARGEDIALVVRVRGNDVVEETNIRLAIAGDGGTELLVVDSRGGGKTLTLRPGEERELRFCVSNPLAKGRYWISLMATNWDGGITYQTRARIAHIEVEAPHQARGFIDVPFIVDSREVTPSDDG